MDIKSVYLNAALPPDVDWIVTTYLGAQYHRDLRPGPCTYKSIVLSMYYMACQTPTASYICTTRPPHSPKVTRCQNSMTASSTGQPPQRQPTSSSLLTIHSYLASPQKTSIQLSIASVGKHYEFTLDRDATIFWT
jgi:hypothetical protein